MRKHYCAFFASVLILSGVALVRAQQSGAQQTSTPEQQAVPVQAPVQQAAPQQVPLAQGAPLKSETREVRVDVIVTDKKGTYVRDLKKEDFKVWEDSKEQSVNTFTFGADPAAPLQQQRHYMVLYFDNSSMDLSDQPRARAAAQKFIDANAGPDRVMAVMDFGGTLRIEQNFTTDVAKLKDAVAGIHASAVSPNETASTTGMANPGLQSIGNAAAEFGAYTLLLSIRNVAKGLGDVPGRKSLILFTAGFDLSSERISELTATIDACNKANVAVYPVDVRGLSTIISKNVPSENGGGAIRLSALRSRSASYGNSHESSRATSRSTARATPRTAQARATSYANSPAALRCMTRSPQGSYRIGCAPLQ
ncbi:MAG: VWA domain-containing protein, partial [Candidatus Acidiferrales bacterium]